MLKEGIHDPGIFKAVFMAGGPGSGKTEAAKRLGLFALGLKNISSDTQFESALKKAGFSLDLATIPTVERDAIRSGAKILTGKRLELAVAGRLGLVIDSTAGNIASIKKQKALLEAIGYETKIVFVTTSLEKSLDRNANRPRVLPADIVTEKHLLSMKNKKSLEQIFGRDYYEISNNGTLADLEKSTTTIFGKIVNYINRAPRTKKATEWIKQMKESQMDELITDVTNRGPDSGNEDEIDPVKYHEILKVNEFLNRALKRIFTGNEWQIYSGPSNILRQNSSYSVQVIRVPFPKGNLARLNSKHQIRISASLTTNTGKFTEMDKVSFVWNAHSRGGAKFKKITGKTLLDASKKVVTWLEKWSLSVFNDLNEDGTTTASIPSGPTSVGIQPNAKFGGSPVFDCDSKTFGSCIKGKKKYGRWSTYLGKDNPFFAQMQSWMSQSSKNNNFVLRNQNTGEMVMARRNPNESVDESKFDKEVVTYTQNGKTKTKKFDSVNGKDGSMAFAREMSKKGFKPITITDAGGTTRKLSENFRNPNEKEIEVEVKDKSILAIGSNGDDWWFKTKEGKQIFDDKLKMGKAASQLGQTSTIFKTIKQVAKMLGENITTMEIREGIFKMGSGPDVPLDSKEKNHFLKAVVKNFGKLKTRPRRFPGDEAIGVSTLELAIYFSRQPNMLKAGFFRYDIRGSDAAKPGSSFAPVSQINMEPGEINLKEIDKLVKRLKEMNK